MTRARFWPWGALIGLALAVSCAPPPDTSADATPPPPHARPSRTPASGVSASPVPNGPFTTVARGVVYDASGSPVGDGYSLHIHSEEPLSPFDRTFAIVGGRYAIIGVPTRAALSFTLLNNGAPVVGRNVAPARDPSQDIVVNFGGPASAEDPDGPHFAAPTSSPAPAASMEAPSSAAVVASVSPSPSAPATTGPSTSASNSP